MIGTNQNRIYSVSEITQLIKQTLELKFFSVEIEGEISNCRKSGAGHLYFTIKDANASISAVIFRNRLNYINFTPADGMLVKVSGSVSVYAPRGSYQVICESISQAGTGQILLMLEKRKQMLAEEGLFDSDRKKPLPPLPETVAVITSPTGAAVRDIINVITRRNSGINLRILPAVVQGTEAAAAIARQIEFADRHKLADVIIIGRGGGSIEDLLPFSEEIVVRAVAAADTPVISAVGHEIDWALSDYAADLRAPTPSAAAELVTGETAAISSQIRQIKTELAAAVRSKVATSRLILSGCSRLELSREFMLMIQSVRQKVDELNESQIFFLKNRISALRKELKAAESSIEDNSPRKILKKGYAIVKDGNNNIIKSSDQLEKGDNVNIEFSTGSAEAQITEKK